MIKYFFAGAEQPPAAAGIYAGGNTRVLLSSFPILAESQGMSACDFGKGLRADNYLSVLASNFRASILDSGIFTFCYGNSKAKADRRSISKWFDAYVQFINEHVSTRTTVVEVDCQRIAGTDYAWQLRRNIKEQCPRHEVMNVWHPEDGHSGLLRLIDFSDYIAVSTAEYVKSIGLRKTEKFVEYFCRLCKSRKPSIKIHLLGCSTRSIIQPVKLLADTCDSISWMSPQRYGGNNSTTRGIVHYEYEHQKYLEVLKKFSKTDKYLMLVPRLAHLSKYFRQGLEKYIGEQD